MRLFEPGDKVTIKISKEDREWGYNRYPDGTIATVVGFTESIRSLTLQPFFSSKMRDQAVRFVDEELGKRVAAETLKGFAVG